MKKRNIRKCKEKIYENNEDESDENESLSDRAKIKIFNRLFTIANIFSSINHYFDFNETQVIDAENNQISRISGKL